MSAENESARPDHGPNPERRFRIWTMEEGPATPPDAALMGASPSVASAPDGLTRRVLKGVGCLLGLTLTLLPALTSNLEAWFTARQDVFIFWGQLFALLPGLPGKYVRKCYYYLTLGACTLDWEIGFLSYFTDRRAEVGRRVYIGVGSYVASATIGDGCLIGSRVSIVGGKRQHKFGPDGRLTPFDPVEAQQVRIGEETWIGEGAVLMADVGSRCIVAAGSIVSNAVPDGRIVGGNPARPIGKTGPWADGT